MISFIKLRRKFYTDVYNKFKTNRLGKNYSKVKALICLELGIILTYFLKTSTRPNIVTIIFILLVLLATILIGSGNKDFILLGIVIFFFKIA